MRVRDSPRDHLVVQQVYDKPLSADVDASCSIQKFVGQVQVSISISPIEVHLLFTRSAIIVDNVFVGFWYFENALRYL